MLSRSSAAYHVLRRLILLLPTLVGLSLLTFTLLRLLPGDPAQVMLGEHASAEQVERFQGRMGLDRPLPVQYVRYLGSLVRGDWGRSLKTNLPVTAEIAQRLPATLELGLAAMFLACLTGIPLGVLSATRSELGVSLVADGAMLIGASVPLFVLGLLLAYVFGTRLGWLPPSGRITAGPGASPVSGLLCSLLLGNWLALADRLQHLILPAVTLSAAPLTVVVRMTRACLRQVG